MNEQIRHHRASRQTDSLFIPGCFELNKAGFTIIPCELIDRNGECLKEIILRYAEKWDLEPAFIEWLEKENVFCCSLVDRIVQVILVRMQLFSINDITMKIN